MTWGTFACPWCGLEMPHHHSPEEVETFKEQAKKREEELERRRLHPSPDASKWPQ